MFDIRSEIWRRSLRKFHSWKTSLVRFILSRTETRQLVVYLYLNMVYNTYLRGTVVVVLTTAKLHSTKPEFKFWAGSNPTRSVSEIGDDENLWQWSQLKAKLNAFCRSIIQQKQFIIIIITEQNLKKVLNLLKV